MTTAITILHCDGHTFHNETSAFARLKELQAHHLPCVIHMSPAPSIWERGRAFRRRRARSPHTVPPRSPKAATCVRSLVIYPPYIPIPGVRHDDLNYECLVELVEGATCKLILQLLAEGKSWTGIIDHLHRTCLEPDHRSRFDVDDIRAIVARCRLLGLTAYTALESEDWSTDEDEKWWIKEDRKRFDSPLGRDICGSSGWWNEVSPHRAVPGT